MRWIAYTCACSRTGEFDVIYNLRRTVQEMIEFAQKPSRDEASDVMINISCLLHSVWPTWVWLLPGAEKSQAKGLRRYSKHGCCRSLRNACSNSLPGGS